MKEWFNRQSKPMKGFLVGALVIIILAVTSNVLKAESGAFPPKPDGAVFFSSGECKDPETGVKGICAIFVNTKYREGEPQSWLIFFVNRDGQQRAMYVKAAYPDRMETIWVSPLFMAEE